MSPENYFLDWQKPHPCRNPVSLNWSTLSPERAESVLCGKTLINATTIDIIKTNRVARRYLSEPLALDKTLPLVQPLSTLELALPN